MFGFVGNLISIHAPIVGCDEDGISENVICQLFQSTHPSWGATLEKDDKSKAVEISIHAPIVGCDSKNSKIPT